MAYFHDEGTRERQLRFGAMNLLAGGGSFFLSLLCLNYVPDGALFFVVLAAGGLLTLAFFGRAAFRFFKAYQGEPPYRINNSLLDSMINDPVARTS